MADNITQMMIQVTQNPAGTAFATANSQVAGVEIAGKTGTAENGVSATNLDDAVFTCFAPATNPKIAVGVIVKGGGFGADAAAPIAVKIIQAYLGVIVTASRRSGSARKSRRPDARAPCCAGRPENPRRRTVTQVRDMTQPRLLGGRYELDGVVGRGGMAEVYRARDIRLDRIVAVKTLREDLARDQTFQARFRREAQSAASLNHPSIVAVYDTGEDMMGPTPVPYIVMEYVDGRTLRDLLRDDRRLLPERALEITDGVLRALDYSHRNGIVHRDIKPGNVMLTRTGEVKVMDFGIARAVSDAQATMTQTAQVIGTAQYLSPEQARGERVDARSDLYSAGCLLYELLTGRPPFTGDSPVAIAYQHVRENPIPPSRVDPEIPAWADSIVLKAMAKDPGDRYQSAGEMRNDIQRALQGMPVAAPMRTENYQGTRRMGAATQHGRLHQRDPAVPVRPGGRGRGGVARAARSGRGSWPASRPWPSSWAWCTRSRTSRATGATSRSRTSSA